MLIIILEHLSIILFMFFILCIIIDNFNITIINIIKLFLISIAIIYLPLLFIYFIIINGGHLQLL